MAETRPYSIPELFACEAELRELQREYPDLHYCMDNDGHLINSRMPEFERWRCQGVRPRGCM